MLGFIGQLVSVSLNSACVVEKQQWTLCKQSDAGCWNETLFTKTGGGLNLARGYSVQIPDQYSKSEASDKDKTKG